MIIDAHDAALASEFLCSSLTFTGGVLTFYCTRSAIAAAAIYGKLDREAIQALTRAIENLGMASARHVAQADPTAPEYRPSKRAGSTSGVSGAGSASPGADVAPKLEPGLAEELDELEDLLAGLIPQWVALRAVSPPAGPSGDKALGVLALPSTGCGARKGIAGAPNGARDAVLEKASLRRARSDAKGVGDQRPAGGAPRPDICAAYASPQTAESLTRPARQTTTR